MQNVVGIIGWPLNYSLSPLMHTAAFASAKLNWAYIPMPVNLAPEHRLKEAIYGLRALGLKGANVTVPYKEAVIPFLDRLSPDAEAIGAVNTIALDPGGSLVGYNTDGEGFMQDLCKKGHNDTDMHVVVLGAGGTARAIVYALLSHGYTKVSIANRTESKACEIASRFRPLFLQATIVSSTLSEAALASMPRPDLLVNTTSVGMGETEMMPWFEGIPLSSAQVVYDVIYDPSMTKLLRFAKGYGATIYNGLGMLVHQGALSFTIWTGCDAPVDVMKRAIQKSL